MDKSVKLSTRLGTVASFLSKGAYFADIGSDHAYLPCYVCLQDPTARAIAGEVAEGPYNSAKETVLKYKLTNVIEVRLGDGLAVVHPDDELDHIVIAGMGGSLIKSILEEGKTKLKNTNRIIAQPNVDARNVRRWLDKHDFNIVDEAIVEENGHIYEIIVADKIVHQLAKKESLSEKELLFGPLLLHNKTDSFYNKWDHEQEKLKKVIAQMKNAKIQDNRKIEQFEKELSWMKGVLRNE